MVLNHAGLTDRGLVRERNEDAFFSLVPGKAAQDKKGSLFVIADGLGGLPDGEIASREAAGKIRNLWDTTPSLKASPWLDHAFRSANRRLLSLNEKKGPGREMATTLTASLFLNHRLYIAHVGDCRVYRAREGSLHRLTQDHSVSRHQLTRTVGLDPHLRVDFSDLPVEKGDRFLQCSDGLHGVLDAKAMASVLLEASPKEACAELAAQANHKGGPDNITLQVIHVI